MAGIDEQRDRPGKGEFALFEAIGYVDKGCDQKEHEEDRHIEDYDVDIK